MKTAAGTALQVTVPTLAKLVEIEGPWKPIFRGVKAPEEVDLDGSISWKEHSDPGVKYFSGTATYRCRFKGRVVEQQRKLYLDLGDVQVIAEVKINGKDLGILWKPPFRVDVTAASSSWRKQIGSPSLVNLWPNRLIGDDALAPDCKWKPGFMDAEVISEWPSWLENNQPSPTGRVSFAAWRLWTKNDPLLVSGLLRAGSPHLRCRSDCVSSNWKSGESWVAKDNPDSVSSLDCGDGDPGV